jgi:hypothetical protein
VARPDPSYGNFEPGFEQFPEWTKEGVSNTLQVAQATPNFPCSSPTGGSLRAGRDLLPKFLRGRSLSCPSRGPAASPRLRKLGY